MNATVDGGVPGKATIEFRLVDFVAFFIFGLRSVDLAFLALVLTSQILAGQSIAGRHLRRREDTIVSHIVESAYRARRAPANEGHEPWEGIRGPGGSRAGVGHARLSKLGESRAGF